MILVTDSLPRLRCLILALSSTLIAMAWSAMPGNAAPPSQSTGNKGVVELETEGVSGISVRIAEEIADVVDDGATRRVLPVVGRGALQNLSDLVGLRGIDMAILQSDVLDYARQQRLPGFDSNITYIAKLYNEEFHLLARADIGSVAALANKKVNVDRRGSGTAVTATRLFDLLKISVDMTNDSQEIALEKLRKGEISALAFVAGKPAPLFEGATSDNGLHLLSIPLKPEVTAVYLPAIITGADYPELVAQNAPVDTVAVGAILAVANLQPLSERYRNVANFVDAFFTEFQSLLGPGYHAKWRDVNLAAELSGWKRFPAADQWLKRNQPVISQTKPGNLKQVFERFLEERLQVAGGAMTQAQKDELFNQFESWHSSQAQAQ